MHVKARFAVGGHARIDGSGTVRDPEPGAPKRLSLGSSFTVGMHHGARYRMTNTIVELLSNQVLVPTPATLSRSREGHEDCSSVSASDQNGAVGANSSPVG